VLLNKEAHLEPFRIDLLIYTVC